MKIRIKLVNGKVVTREIKSKRGYKIYKKTKRGVIWIKSKQKKKKVAKRVSEKARRRKEAVAKIKGLQTILKKRRKEEIVFTKELFKKIKMLPKIDKRFYANQINPKGLVITNNKVYSSYNELLGDSRGIYLNVILGEVAKSNPKILDNIYKFRKQILGNGISKV